ncbi:MAG: hypothetical protein V3V61_01815 [Gammaproteobacteria bacterium]
MADISILANIGHYHFGMTHQDLLGHKSTHYSGAELSNLIVAADKVCSTDNNMPVLIMSKNNHPHKIPTVDLRGGN